MKSLNYAGSNQETLCRGHGGGGLAFLQPPCKHREAVYILCFFCHLLSHHGEDEKF